jgi:hypothetical protein
MNKIPHFKHWVQKVLPVVYEDSLSHYELLLKVMDHINNYGDTTNDLIDVYNAINEWIVSDELKNQMENKLDLWATDGTLDNIINERAWGELYPLVINDQDNYSINIEHFYDPAKPLEYWVTTITPNDGDALRTLLKKDYAYTPNGEFDTYSKEAVHKNAYRNRARFAINASGWIPNQDSRMVGVQVKNGVVHKDSDDSLQTWYTLGVTSQGILKTFPATVTGSELVNEHDIVNTWSFSIPLVENGVKVSDSIFQLYSPSYYTPYARQVIGQRTGTNEIIILTVDKNDARSIGMTLTECADLMVSRGCRVAYNLDGGGSTQTVYNGEYLNTPSDGIPRETCDILYVGKYANYDEYSNIQKEVFGAIGSFDNLAKVFDRVQKEPLTLENGTVDYSNRGAFDFNHLYGTKFFRHYTDEEQSHLVLNAPFEGGADYFILNMQSTEHSRAQFVLNRSNAKMAYRFNNIGTWGAWRVLDGNAYATFEKLSLQNGWVNLGGGDPDLQYSYKNGVVELRGVIKGGTANSAAATLPEHCRPKSRIQVGTVRNDGAGDVIGRLFITTSGAIIPIQAASSYIYIQTSFLAE